MLFDKLRRALTSKQPAGPAPRLAAEHSHLPEWAASQGFAFSSHREQIDFSLKGMAGGKPWRLEVGPPSRKYIQGQELRARADLGIDADVAVLVLNLPLKKALERQLFARCTDGLQTNLDANMPEEMRWIAAYEEASWESAPRAFWARYAVLAARGDHAPAWLDPLLINQLLEWPAPGPDVATPFVLMLLRGKAYLRMQHDPEHPYTVQHATHVFTTACGNALGAFAPAASS